VSAASYTLAPFDLGSPLLPGVLEVYQRVWGDRGFQPQVRRHATYPAFKGIAALAPSGEIAGYVYGTSTLPGQWWPDRIAVVIGYELAERRLYGSFNVTELGVRAEHRRRGLATCLMRAVLANLPHQHVTLSTECANRPARTLYEGLGFGYLIERMRFAEGGDEYAVLDRPLPLD
jgi:ribosomal protein S18 acetylase RimI-like enzyme